jgi:hypothetical protein
VDGYVKRRDRPVTGSIPDVLDIFRSEVRFYREIAPVVGVRVPACYQAEDGAEGTLLVLEDLSAWRAGADPVVAARLLAHMHGLLGAFTAVGRGHRRLRRWPGLGPGAPSGHSAGIAELVRLAGRISRGGGLD